MGSNDMPDLVRRAPKLRREDIREINGTFRAFIFRRRRTGELWTSCCGRHIHLEKGKMTPEEKQIMAEEHSREPKSTWDRYTPVEVTCPYCGKKAQVKELGRIGDGDNLADFGRGIVLRWRRGSLWAIVYDAGKWYSPRREDRLTAEPDVRVNGAFRFQLGEKSRVEWVFRSWFDTAYNDGWQYARAGNCTDGMKVKKIPLPFATCKKYGSGYDTINAGEWEKTPMRWCKLRPGTSLRYIAACTFWPRQVEMLGKAGLMEIVDDLAERGVKNAYIFDWQELDPRKSFDLDGGELKEFLSVRGNSKALLIYHKKLNKAGFRVDFHELRILELKCGAQAEKVITRLARYKFPPARWEKYIERERGTGRTGFVAEQWVDYVDAAEFIGLDMKNPIVLCPKNLYQQHDEKTETAERLRAAEKDKKNAEKESRRFKALMKRYTFWDDRYLIRPPLGAKEIQREGSVLRHCVAGYADRHVEGKTTILFLRDRKRPGKPLATIEMRGNEIVQIHGYRNELASCQENPSRQRPEKLYAGILEPWLEWLKAGSKRNKDWTPKEIKKEADVA